MQQSGKSARRRPGAPTTLEKHQRRCIRPQLSTKTPLTNRITTTHLEPRRRPQSPTSCWTPWPSLGLACFLRVYDLNAFEVMVAIGCV